MEAEATGQNTLEQSFLEGSFNNIDMEKKPTPPKIRAVTTSTNCQPKMRSRFFLGCFFLLTGGVSDVAKFDIGFRDATVPKFLKIYRLARKRAVHDLWLGSFDVDM
jgi:hypothetical protein